MNQERGVWSAVTVFFALIIFPLLVHATTYYVDSVGGADGSNGTSSSTPWQTIAKVNSSTFSAGDSILFKKSDVWYGNALLVPSGGASGTPIAFGNYGTGADPIIKGSTLLATGGYTLAPDTSSTIFSLSDSGTNSTDSATRNWREQVAHAGISADATKITITVKASPTASLVIVGAGIGPATTAPNASSITRITWDGGANGTTVATNTAKTSDEITYNLDHTVDQIITIYTTARNVEYYTNNNTTLWTNFSGPDQSQSSTVSGYSTGGNSVIGTITSFTTTQYTYRNTLGSSPVAVWENGTLLASKSSPALVEATAGSWYDDGTYLYIHASDNSNVASNGKTYTYATGASPSYTTWDNGKNYLVFNGLDQAETYNTSSATLGGLYLTGDNNIVENLSSHDMYRHPITVYVGAKNNTVNNVTAYNSYGTSPIAIYGSGTTGNLVEDSTFYNDTSAPPGSGWGVIVVHGGSSGNTVDSCTIYSTAASAKGIGILVGDASTTLTISHNLIYGTFSYGANVGSGDNDSLGDGATITMYGNLLNVSQANNSGILLTGSVGSAIYNNTIYGPSNTNAAISQTTSSIGTIVKNNIFWTGGYVTVDAASEASTAYDYNLYYSAAGNPFSWGGVTYTFANWKTTSGQDAHSLSLDPVLTNAASSTFTLASSSPAIDTGVNLGTSYDTGLDPASTWPSSVVLDNENNYGAGWDLGAFIYTQTSTPSIVMTAPANGATVSSTVTISASSTAASPASVVSVQFYLDGSPLGSPVTSTSSPNVYSYSWNTSSSSGGSHVLYALATDNYANTATSSNITLTVNNTPPVPGGSISVITGSSVLVSPSMISTEPSSTDNMNETLSVQSLQLEIAALQVQVRLLLGEVAARTTGVTVDASAFTQNLQWGDKDADVTALQKFLIAQNKGNAAQALAAHGVTGDFAALTFSALVEYQKSVGIRPASGYFGPITRAYVNAHE